MFLLPSLPLKGPTGMHACLCLFFRVAGYHHPSAYPTHRPASPHRWQRILVVALPTSGLRLEDKYNAFDVGGHIAHGVTSGYLMCETAVA